jgi:hypothetical protein
VARWLIIGPVAVVALDILASVAARTLDFDYGSLWPPTLLTVSVAFLTGRDTEFNQGWRVGRAGARVHELDCRVGSVMAHRAWCSRGC